MSQVRTRQKGKKKPKDPESIPSTPTRKGLAAKSHHGNAGTRKAKPTNATVPDVPETDPAETSTKKGHRSNRLDQSPVAQLSPTLATQRLAEGRSALAPEDVLKWLPPNYVTLANSCKGQEEWKAKVRWIIAVVFYRMRAFSTPVLRAVLQALQPTNNGILDTNSPAIFTWFRETVVELQDTIWLAHEGLAKVFLLNTVAGKQYAKSYSQKTLGHRSRPRMTAEQLQDLLPLSVSDVRGIWAAIEFTADFTYWDPMSRATKVFMEALRRTTYGLVVRIIGHWIRGGNLNTDRSICPTSRAKDFQSTSNVDDPPSWPKPPSSANRPSSTQEWLEFSSTYNMSTDSPYYSRLINRITELEPSPDSNLQSTVKRGSKEERPTKAKCDGSNGEGTSDEDDNNTSIDSDSSLSEVDSLSDDDSIARQLLDLSQNQADIGTSKETKRTSQIMQQAHKTPPASATFTTGIKSVDSSFRAQPEDALDDMDDNDSLNADSPGKPSLPALRTFHSIEKEKSQLPPFPTSSFSLDSSKAHMDNWGTTSMASEQRLGLEPGPSLSMRLLAGQPPDLDDYLLPQDEIKTIKRMHDSDQTKHNELARHLYDEGMDDSWYENSESGLIATLSSVGKAEYAMCCLNRDIQRYTNLICRLHELKNRDLKIIEELKVQRLVAVENQKLVESLHRERMGADLSRKRLMKEQRLGKTLHGSIFSGSPEIPASRVGSGGGPNYGAPHTRIPFGSQALDISGVEQTGFSSHWNRPLTGMADYAASGDYEFVQGQTRNLGHTSINEYRESVAPGLPVALGPPVQTMHYDDLRTQHKKRKAERKALRHAAKRARTAQLEHADSSLNTISTNAPIEPSCKQSTTMASSGPNSPLNTPITQGLSLTQPTGTQDGGPLDKITAQDPKSATTPQPKHVLQVDLAMGIPNGLGLDQSTSPEINYEDFYNAFKPRTRPDSTYASAAQPSREPKQFGSKPEFENAQQASGQNLSTQSPAGAA